MSLFLFGPNFGKTSRHRAPFVLFAVAALLYTISLSDLNALYLTGAAYTLAHVLLRVVFSAAFVYLCGDYSFQRKSVLYLHALIFAVLLAIGMRNPDSLVKAYENCFVVFPLATALAASDLLRKNQSTNFSNTLGTIAVAWSLLQMHDLIRFLFIPGHYTGSSVVAIVTGLLAYHRHQDILEIQHRSELLKTEFKRRESLLALSTQVAHDIRSPLAALSIAESDLAGLNSETRTLLRGAIARIREISRELLSNARPSSETIALSKLRDLIEAIAAESRLRFKARHSLRITTAFSESVEEICAVANAQQLQIVVSNLITNAAEAIPDCGNVTVRLIRDLNFVKIEVSDDGIGIPQKLIPLLGSRGFTFGKNGGG